MLNTQEWIPICALHRAPRHSQSSQLACRRNVVIISPHPDDDVIGAGGTMALLARAGYNLFSLYVTDGRPTAGRSRGIARIRRQEALNALAVVKARGALFLPYAGSQLRSGCRPAAVRAIRRVLQALRPSAVYLPSLFERHPTHVLVAGLALQALGQIRRRAPEIWGYSVWGSFAGEHGTRAVDISSVAHLKRTAIRQHRSQLRSKAYDEGMLGRNRYEAVFLETHKPESFAYAELFLDMHARHWCTDSS